MAGVVAGGSALRVSDEVTSLLSKNFLVTLGVHETISTEALLTLA